MVNQNQSLDKIQLALAADYGINAEEKVEVDVSILISSLKKNKTTLSI